MQLQNHKPVTGIPKWYDKVPYLDELSLIYPFSVDHEIAGRGPKIGERAYARSPIFGNSFEFREVLILTKNISKVANSSSHCLE
jgi:hypothetical protein